MQHLWRSLCALLLWSTLAPAYTFDPTVIDIPSATYGVANEGCETPSGGDITLTTASSWESAIESAAAGSRFFLRAGTYTTTTLTIAHGGSATPITVKAYNCEAVTLNTVVQPGNYTILAGVTAKAVNFTRGAPVTGAIIRNNTLRSNGTVPNGVLRFGDTTVSTLVQGNDIATSGAAGEHDHVIFVRDAVGSGNLITANKLSNIASSGGEDLLQMNNWSGTWRFSRNWFGANSSEDHVDIKASTSGAGPATLEIWENYFDGPGLTGPGGVGSVLIQGDAVNFSYTADVKGNYFYQSPKTVYHRVVPDPAVPNQNGRRLDFTYNVVNALNTTQFAAQVEANNASFVHNTFLRGNFRTGSNGWNPGACLVRNNIFYQSNFQDSTGVDTCSHNVLFSTTGTSPAVCTNTITSDPLFVNAASNWALQSASPARNAGNDGLDIGAYGPPGVDFTSNLRMHLKFDEGTGSTAQDSTVNNHDGTLGSGASWGAATIGASALTVDGTTNGIVTVSGLLSTPSSITLAAWIKRSAFPTTDGEVISLGNLVLLRQSATTLTGRYDAGTGQVSTTASATLGTTAWHHLAYTVAPGRQRLYLNGELVGSTSSTAAINYTGAGTNTIIGGHGALSTSFRFQGSIDDVRVYTRELTASDITGLAAYTEPPPLQVQITSPTTNTSHSVSTTPLTNLAGVASDDIGVTQVTWTCSTCTPSSGTATCTPACGAAATAVTWSVASIGLTSGTNLITVTAHESGGTKTDQLTVTYTAPPAAGTCTHYASPSGGGNGLSQGSPFQIAQFWAVAAPGQTLCLLDGTYTGGNAMIQPPAGLVGTDSLPITVQALNPGAVLLDGQNARNPVVLAGTNQWFVVQGLNARNGLTGVYQFLGSNNRGKRLIGWNATSGQANAAVFTVTGTNTIVEDCAGWGTNARIIFQGSGTLTSTGSGYRRCWGEWNDHPEGGTAAGATFAPGVGQFLENVIGTVRRTGQ